MEDDDIGFETFRKATRYKSNLMDNKVATMIVVAFVLLIPVIILLFIQTGAKLSDSETISMLQDRGYVNVVPTTYEPTMSAGQCPYRPGGYQIGRDFNAVIDGHNVTGVLCTGTLKNAPEVLILSRKA